MQAKLALVVTLLLAIACASPPSREMANAILESAGATANARLREGLVPEVEVLLHAVERVDPDYPGVPELRQRLGPESQDELMNRGRLGINRRLRVREGAGFLRRLIFYPIDRVFDVLDLITVDLHLGFGVFADVHVTRAAQLAGGIRSLFGVGLHDQRSIGFKSESEVGVAALALGAQTLSGSSTGIPAGIITAAGTTAGMHSTRGPIYQDYRDYWAFGASATGGLVGGSVDLHPVQLFDAIGGIFLIDFARDDLATTRRLRLTQAEYEIIKELYRVERAGIWPGEPDKTEEPEETDEP
jgi:hypothetical protein